MFLHFRSVNAPDYYERRERVTPPALRMARYGSTYRLAHINMCLDMRSVIRAAGPSADGTAAEIFYHVADPGALEDLLRDDPYVVGRVWTSWSTRRLLELVEPSSEIPVCLDGSRRVTAVEVPTRDCYEAATALRRLRDEGVMAVGGVTEEGMAIAWMRTTDRSEALRQVLASDLGATREATAHPMIWVL